MADWNRQVAELWDIADSMFYLDGCDDLMVWLVLNGWAAPEQHRASEAAIEAAFKEKLRTDHV